MRRPKKESIILFFILGVGLLLRLWGINFGLPYQFHQDEPIVVNHALAYGTGDFNPHFFIIPPLTSYLLFFCYALYFLFLKICGVIAGPDAFAVSFFKDPTPFYLMGRIMIGVIPSLVNIYVTYRLALAFFTKKVALYAALAMAVIFLNVLNAHYLYTDNLMVMFVLLAYISIACLFKEPRLKWYVFSGIFIGMATATKYNSILVVIPLFLAHAMAKKGKIKNILFNREIIICLGATAITFIACNPFSMLDWKFFMLSVTGRIRHGYIGWRHHITYSMFEGLGGIFTIVGMAGLLVALKVKLKQTILLLSFPLIFYLHLVLASQPFPRYILVLIPFLCIGVSFFLFEYFYERWNSRFFKALIVLSALLILTPTAIKSLKTDALLRSKDTRVEAQEWIEKNIPSAARIALSHTFFSPPLKATLEQLKEKRIILNKQPELKQLKEKKLDLQVKAYDATKKGYNIYYIIEGNENIGQFLDFWPVIKNDLAELKQRKIKYVVFDNMQSSPEMTRLHREIAAQNKPLVSFNPYYGKEIFTGPFDEVETTCLATRDKELFLRKKPGPSLIIYQIQ